MTRLPSRLHHTAYVTKDLEATRKFYEDVIGLPLVATWCEKDFLFGADRTYCHCFFGLGDGSALAFFQFADPKDQELFGPPMPDTPFCVPTPICPLFFTLKVLIGLMPETLIAPTTFTAAPSLGSARQVGTCNPAR